MAFTFDHVLIAVNDLETAIVNFTGLGFTVIRGGEHASRTTHNALICFADGAYIELIAPTGYEPQPGADFRFMLRAGEGLVGYALESDDLVADVMGMRARGIIIDDPSSGARRREDGVTLHWRSAMMGKNIAPFFIQDETARNLRVPDDPGSITHANGVTGVHGVGVIVEDLSRQTPYFRALLNTTPEVMADSVTFTLNGVYINLREASDSATQQHLDERQHAPYRLLLRTATNARHLHEANAHGARIQLVVT